MTATILALAPLVDLVPGDRFALTALARTKLLPRGKVAGVIVADGGDFWRCRFDGQAFNRTVAKVFIGRETR